MCHGYTAVGTFPKMDVIMCARLECVHVCHGYIALGTFPKMDVIRCARLECVHACDHVNVNVLVWVEPMKSLMMLDEAYGETNQGRDSRW